VRTLNNHKDSRYFTPNIVRKTGTTGEPQDDLLHPRPWLAQHEATRPKAQWADSSNEATRAYINAGLAH
jgi:hypothetical protein